jgi:hypothetical protein
MNQDTKDLIASTIVSSLYLLVIVGCVFVIGYLFGFMLIVYTLAGLKFIEFAGYIKKTIVEIYRI